ncbi:hypothetical protein AURDEDRAFT_127600 [Auricularia subglabra TFB-10046 SS5]|nr:hypothetical protein AURDEDRAFT_127600 [Auricularia subglabra TFB-10046 SS5]
MATQSNLANRVQRGEWLFVVGGRTEQDLTVRTPRYDTYVGADDLPHFVLDAIHGHDSFVQILNTQPDVGRPAGWEEFDFNRQYNMVPWTVDVGGDLGRAIEVNLRIIQRPNPDVPRDLALNPRVPNMFPMAAADDASVDQGAAPSNAAAAQVAPRPATHDTPAARRATVHGNPGTPRPAGRGTPATPRAASNSTPVTPRPAGRGTPLAQRTATHGQAVGPCGGGQLPHMPTITVGRRAASGPVRGNLRMTVNTPRSVSSPVPGPSSAPRPSSSRVAPVGAQRRAARPMAGAEVRRSSRVATKCQSRLSIPANNFILEDDDDDEEPEVVEKPRRKKRTKEEIGYVGVSSDEERQLSLKRRRKDDDDGDHDPRMTQRLRVE